MKKIFISHSSEDNEYVEQIVNLLIGMGLDREHFFCTSLPGYGIPADIGVIDYLREQRSNYELHVIFVHSNNYYNSTDSLIEMGAARAILCEETSILLPDVNFEDMIRTINEESLIKLCRTERYIKNRLNDFYDKIVNGFDLERNDDCIWEQTRDSFIKEVELIWFDRIQLSNDAATLLDVFTDYDPVYIINEHDYPYGLCRPNEDVQVLNIGFDGNETDRWNSALEELLTIGFVKQVRNETEYKLTYSGHQYWSVKWADIVLFRMTYDEYVNFLLFKYGKVPGDYYLNEDCARENPDIKRSREALVIHHIDEDKIPGLSSNRMGNISFDYQRADRLVYCHFVEHTILHMKIIEEELTRDIGERNRENPVGIVGFSKMVTDINYGYTGGDGKQSSCLQRNTMETYWQSFSGPWTSRVAKIIKFFIENIVIRNDFQEWYGDRGYFGEWPGSRRNWRNLGDFLTFIHQLYDSNPIEFNDTIDMESFRGVYDVFL